MITLQKKDKITNLILSLNMTYIIDPLPASLSQTNSKCKKWRKKSDKKILNNNQLSVLTDISINTFSFLSLRDDMSFGAMGKTKQELSIVFEQCHIWMEWGVDEDKDNIKKKRKTSK